MQTILLAALASTAYSSVYDCSSPNSTFKIDTLIFNPNNPHFGEDTMLYIKFNNTGLPIVNGTITTAITYNSKQFSYNVNSLCNRVICPISYGINMKNFTNKWPYLSGKFTIKATWTDIYNKQLLCLQIKQDTSLYNKLGVLNLSTRR
jgi:hypothetical protein